MPKFVKLTLMPASGSEGSKGRAVTQVIKVENSQHGVKALALRIKVTFTLPAGEGVVEQFDFKGFPPGI